MSVVIEAVNKAILPTDRMLLAMSGGLDSTVLFHALIQSHKSFAVVHINYQLRDEDSAADEAFVRELCTKHDIPFTVIVCPTAFTKGKGINLQQAARDFRRSWFKQWCATSEHHVVLLGQHANDQHETFWLQLFRGAGITGLSGMDVRSDSEHYRLVRPFLAITKAEIKQFAEVHSLLWREDLSNQYTVYLRNWFRLEGIPFLEQEQPYISESVGTFQAALRETISELKKKNAVTWQQAKASRQLTLETWAKWSDTERILFLQSLGLSAQWLSDWHRLTSMSAGKKIICTSNQVQLVIEQFNRTLFWSDGTLPMLPKLRFSEVPENVHESNNSSILVPAHWVKEMVIRNIQSGDRIALPKVGRKRVNDLLKENGIPSIHRPEKYVVCRGNEILWIPEIRISNNLNYEKGGFAERLVELVDFF